MGRDHFLTHRIHFTGILYDAMLKCFSLFLFVLMPTSSLVFSQGEDSLKVSAQNPSPMVDYTRIHRRITQTSFKGIDFFINTVLPKPIEVFVPSRSIKARSIDLLIHFHGASFVVKYAAERYRGRLAATSINLGVGSKAYGDTFKDSAKFSMLLDSIIAGVVRNVGHRITVRKIILSSFSAGYGAIRQIISNPLWYKKVDAILLLDGIHASYIPEGKVLSQGGKIDSAALDVFKEYARDASHHDSNKKFLITHSEIFPGTFASTTEATDYILQKLGMRRCPILEWGPLGMQGLSIARSNHFEVLGFAGNTGPDHIGHLHALFHFLNVLMTL